MHAKKKTYSPLFIFLFFTRPTSFLDIFLSLMPPSPQKNNWKYFPWIVRLISSGRAKAVNQMIQLILELKAPDTNDYQKKKRLNNTIQVFKQVELKLIWVQISMGDDLSKHLHDLFKYTLLIFSLLIVDNWIN